jgi:hypothetical protein
MKKSYDPFMLDPLMMSHEGVALMQGHRTYISNDKIHRHDNATIQFRVPYSTNNIIYYEVTIINVSKSAHDGAVGIGIAPVNYGDGMVGWYTDSIGYHGDDGIIYTGTSTDSMIMQEQSEDNIIEQEDTDDDDSVSSWESVESNEDIKLQTYGTGDTVGLLYDKNQGTVQFSKNGTFYQNLFQVNSNLYPTISIDAGITFSVNFGDQAPFLMKGIPMEWTYVQVRKKMDENRVAERFTDVVIIVISDM